jgi:hypothetical protein
LYLVLNECAVCDVSLCPPLSARTKQAATKCSAQYQWRSPRPQYASAERLSQRRQKGCVYMHITAVDEHPYPTEEPRGSVCRSVRLFTGTQPAVSTDRDNKFSEILNTSTKVSLLRTGPRICGSYSSRGWYIFLAVLTGSGGHPITGDIFLIFPESML